MRKIVTILITFLVVSSITSCNIDPPSEVIDDINRKNSREKDDEISNEIEYDTLENIYNSIDEVLGKEYENLNLHNSININRPKELPILKLEQVSNYDKKFDTIANALIHQDRFNKKYIDYAPNTSPPGPEYKDTATGEHLGVGDNGFVYYEAPGYEMSSDAQLVKTIYPHDKDETDKSYELKDGEMKVSDAITKAEEFLENTWQPISDDLPYIIDHRDICKLEDKYFYKIALAKNYKDIYINNTFNTCIDIELTCFENTIIIESTENISNLAVTMGAVFVNEEVATEDKYVTLESALDMVRNKLAEYEIFDILSIQLRYAPKLLLEQEDDSGEVLLKTDAGTKLEARPHWAFVLDRTHGYEQIIWVDAITGEMRIMFNNVAPEDRQ